MSELLCDTLANAEDAAALSFVLLEDERVIAEQTSYTVTDGEAFTDGIGRKVCVYLRVKYFMLWPSVWRDKCKVCGPYTDGCSVVMASNTTTAAAGVSCCLNYCFVAICWRQSRRNWAMTIGCISPFWTTVPSWRKNNGNLTGLSLKRDCRSRRVKLYLVVLVLWYRVLIIPSGLQSRK